MKRSLLACTLFTYMASPAFANPDYVDEAYLIPKTSWARPSLGASQMTVTPTSTGSFNNIRIITYTTNNATCGGTASTWNATSGFVATTLLNGHPYTTTDASNWVVFNPAGTYQVPHNDVDAKFFFSNDGSSNVGSFSPCIVLNAADCTNASNCGFGSTINWNWTP